VPAVFRTVDTTANRLDMGLAQSSSGLDLTLRYGDQQTGITLIPD